LALLFPPELVPHVRTVVTPNRALMGVSDHELGKLLTLVFFASLEAEEGEYHPIRVLLGGEVELTPEPEDGVLLWAHSRFLRPRTCTVRDLRRLSRATMPDWTFVHVGKSGGELKLLGLARRGPSVEDDRFLGVVSPAPGRLEIWSRGQRALEYAQGRLVPAPENVILSAGPVYRTLEGAAALAGVVARVRPLYLQTVGAMVRSMAEHGHGGILAIGPSLTAAPVAEHGGFDVEHNPALLALLEQLVDLDVEPKRPSSFGESRLHATEVLRAALRIGIDSAIAEVGGLTALDGATLLDASLAARAFGVVLSTAARPEVMLASGAEPGDVTPFPLDGRGARHRAAAAFAHERAGTAVFVASRDGDLACMLRERSAPQVLMWRCTTARSDSA
jgi:hypothetical protein